MKQQYDIKFFKAALSLAFIFTAFISEIKAQNTSFSKPGKAINYLYVGNSWLYASSSIFTYNAAGQLTEELRLDQKTNEKFTLQVRKYDSLGILRALLNYYDENGNWHLHDGSRDSVVYSGSKIRFRYLFLWNGGDWNKSRIEYIYDTNNYLVQENYGEEDLLFGGWVVSGKIVYINNANGIITQKQFHRNWPGSGWEHVKDENYTSWHTPNILPASYTTSINGIEGERVQIKLGDNGSQTKLTELFFTSDSTWKPMYRETTTNDFRGNFINGKAERFHEDTGTWETSSEQGERITYNSYFDITEKVEYWSVSNSVPLVLKDRIKTVYSNFQYFGQAPEKIITAYPNPTEGILNIGLENEEEALQVNVFDLTGKPRLNRSFTATETKELNLEALPKGIYLLQLQTETGSTVKRIVKQ